MAITKGTFKSYFQQNLAQMIINRNQVHLLVVDSESEMIEQWID
ncbi:MAG: element excision factor XisH family protein [Cyanobacteria bacterium P01_A01_bin.80]